MRAGSAAPSPARCAAVDPLPPPPPPPPPPHARMAIGQLQRAVGAGDGPAAVVGVQLGDGERGGVEAPEGVERGAERVDQRGLDDAAVGDRERRAVRGGLLVEPAGDARGEGAQRLAVVRRGVGVADPGGDLLRRRGVEIGERAAGPGAEVALGDARLDDRRQPGGLGRLRRSGARGSRGRRRARAAPAGTRLRQRARRTPPARRRRVRRRPPRSARRRGRPRRGSRSWRRDARAAVASRGHGTAGRGDAPTGRRRREGTMHAA